MKNFTKKLYTFLVYFFLYAPILVLIVQSFNASKYRTDWGGFSLKWYAEMFQDRIIMSSLQNTLIIALLSATIATIIGTFAAIGIHKMKPISKSVTMNVSYLPILNPDIVTGISLMLLFTFISIPLGFVSLLLSHITFNIPYVIMNVLPKLRQMNPHQSEAALDLGATPWYTFKKVIFPEIQPGIISGFLFALTLSIDDFIISFFTTGPGVPTLSITIYSMTRRGVSPKLTALSALMFVVVMALLLLVNYGGNKDGKKIFKPKHGIRKWKSAIAVAVVISLFVGIFAIDFIDNHSGPTLKVFNCGEYIDEEILDMFEEETGIRVIYDTYETNEDMYNKVKSVGLNSYDICFPSDYMTERMIEEDMLAEINFDNIPNYKYIGDEYKHQSFDPEDKYSVPYMWGTVGLAINTNLVDEEITSWDVLWDPQYKGQILALNSERDAISLTLKALGYSLNSEDPKELEEAKQALLKQKNNIQAYIGDQVKEKMINEEAAIAVLYSGDGIALKQEDPKFKYVIPEEGTNKWIDSMVILKNAENKKEAELFINFLCRPDIAQKNVEYICYSTPNTAAKENLPDDLKHDKACYPDAVVLNKCEIYENLAKKKHVLQAYSEIWTEVLSQ